jgi:alpha-amylase/alpha-mannosidase (GH57 family)
MADVALAFLWHQHQPYYPDDVTGENPMPWVRLHSVKDYYGMAMHLLEVPEMRCTINLVPSLVHQIRGYTERNASDRHLDVSRIPAADLTEDQALFVVGDFFMANPDTMIRPFPRYYELYLRRNLGRSAAHEARARFEERDLRDLQVWFNLAWIHPLAVAADPGLKDMQARGRNFTEADKQYVLDRHLDILRQVLPLHRRLAESGQVELTTTPFFHPILPLLLDKRLAREAIPEVKLPRHLAPYHQDAEWHVKHAVAYHQEVFGAAPHGMWPAEGSVCQSMLPLLAEHGIRWIATDEEILAASTHGLVSRDGRGHVRNPQQMYQPYRVAEGDAALSIVFRDHALSDLIGFHYQRSEAAAAAEDFIAKIQGIGAAIPDAPIALAPVILDGENCWEHYPGGGVKFLRALYHRATTTKGVRPVTIGEYLREHPPHNALPHLFAGSWISHNFDIWIGHDEDNIGWDLLHQTREHLRLRQEQGLVPGDRLHRAWTEIRIAEGSDWYWWYGPHHSSPQDHVFDYLFRRHLQNVYRILGDQPPSELSRPISHRAVRAIHTSPNSFLSVKVNGRRMPLEWMGAGRYTVQNERGTMAMVTRGPITDVYFGFDAGNLFVRIDFEDNAAQVLAEYDKLRVCFAAPAGVSVEIEPHRQPSPATVLWRGGTETAEPGIRFGVGQIAEVAVPFDALRLRVNDAIQFYVELWQGGQSRDRAPRDSTISLTRPSPDFEQIMWDV